jgi:hypothetical protein
MLELDERKKQLDNIQAITEDVIKNKDIIQNIAIVYDYKLPDGANDCSLSYVGNYNAILGLFERQKIYELVKATTITMRE